MTILTRPATNDIVKVEGDSFMLDTNKMTKLEWYSFVYKESHYAVRVLDNGNVELAETG